MQKQLNQYEGCLTLVTSLYNLKLQGRLYKIYSPFNKFYKLKEISDNEFFTAKLSLTSYKNSWIIMQIFFVKFDKLVEFHKAS